MNDPERINYPPIEKENETKRIVLRVILTRHGPKANARGEKDALASSFEESVGQGFEKMELENGEGLVHVSSSTLPRAEKSAGTIEAKLAQTSRRRGKSIRGNKNLEVPFKEAGPGVSESHSSDLEKIIKMQAMLEPTIRAAVRGERPGISAEEEENEVRNRIDMEVVKKFFADDIKQSPEDRYFQTSYHELADALAKRYLGFGRRIKNLEKMRSSGQQQPADEPYVEIDVSHSFPIVAFLKKYLVFKDGQAAISMDSDDFFRRLGGMIRESDAINLNYLLADGKVTLEVEGEFEPGRKFEGIIDLEKQDEKEN